MPPPHTRGSTVKMSICLFDCRASPAYAGIDPLSSLLIFVGKSLPRIRGDRPLGDWVQKIAKGPPPHTRGSTCPKSIPNHRQYASPAYAGIDPNNRFVIAGGKGLPRIRGDRPI